MSYATLDVDTYRAMSAEERSHLEHWLRNTLYSPEEWEERRPSIFQLDAVPDGDRLAIRVHQWKRDAEGRHYIVVEDGERRAAHEQVLRFVPYLS